MKPKQLIILGGGTSIREGINSGLWSKLQGKFVFSLNEGAFFFFNDTIPVFVDETFYKDNLDIYKEFPFVIGHKTPETERFKLDNTVLLKSEHKHYYRNDCIQKGIYSTYWCGIFALTLGIYLSPHKKCCYAKS